MTFDKDVSTSHQLQFYFSRSCEGQCAAGPEGGAVCVAPCCTDLRELCVLDRDPVSVCLSTCLSLSANPAGLGVPLQRQLWNQPNKAACMWTPDLPFLVSCCHLPLPTSGATPPLSPPDQSLPSTQSPSPITTLHSVTCTNHYSPLSHLHQSLILVP